MHRAPAWLSLFLIASACGRPDAAPAECQHAERRCDGDGALVCVQGRWSGVEDCAAKSLQCDAARGCVLPAAPEPASRGGEPEERADRGGPVADTAVAIPLSGAQRALVASCGEGLAADCLEVAGQLSADPRQAAELYRRAAELFRTQLSSAAGTETPPEPALDDRYIRAVSRVGPWHVRLSRAALGDALSDLEALGEQARIIPNYRDGEYRGFKLVGVRPGSLYRALGIRSGDIIRAINGAPIDSPNKAMELVEGLRTAAQLRLTVERRGETHELRIDIDGAVEDVDCEARPECRERGRCASVGGVCVATSDQDCVASGACARLGRCAVADDECEATSDERCAASAACRLLGKCTQVGTQCRVGESGEGCPKSAACTDLGQCEAAEGRCVAPWSTHVLRPWRRYVRARLPARYRLSRAALRRRPEPLCRARLVPHYAEGELRGVKLVGVRLSSLCSAFGIRSGDVLVAVAGKPVAASDPAGADLFEALREAPVVTIDLLRRGRPVKIQVQIEDGPLLDCGETEGCRQLGLCLGHGRRCLWAAETDADCMRPHGAEGVVPCAVAGQCAAERGRCVATAESCAAARVCAALGQCSEASGVCVVDSEEACRASEICRELGRCAASAGECSPTGPRR